MKLPFISRALHEAELAALRKELLAARGRAYLAEQDKKQMLERLFDHLAGKFTDVENVGVAYATWHSDAQSDFWDAVAKEMATWPPFNRGMQLLHAVQDMSPEARELLREMANYAADAEGKA
jgi:hypothetical protein